MSTDKGSGELVRALDWKGAFWVAAGVPPLVLFSIGGIAGTTGKLAFLVWIISMIMGFLQSFTYAEIAGMFGNKSGGTSVYGATAWLRYSKFIAPLSVWCNWFAWSPVLSLGCANGFFDHLERELDDAGFFKTEKKKPTMRLNLRNMFVRAELTEQEIRSLRGMVSSLTRTHLRGKEPKE